jgi:hypothetical protein
MGRDRSQQATPDLFSTASSGEPSPPAKQVLSTHEGRHVLPKDLPNAVKHLNDRELDLLITASLEEAKRRGRLLPSVQANTPDQSLRQRRSQMAKSSQRRQVEVSWHSGFRGGAHADIRRRQLITLLGGAGSVAARGAGAADGEGAARRLLTGPRRKRSRGRGSHCCFSAGT